MDVLEYEDILEIVYRVLLSDPLISDKVTDARVKFYEYPKTGDKSAAYMVISPINDMPKDHADDDIISTEYIIQIDTWIGTANSGRKEMLKIVAATDAIMRQFGFGLHSSGGTEYDPETKRYRVARRYVTTRYTRKIDTQN